MPRMLSGQTADDMHPLGAQRLTCNESFAGRALLHELFRHSHVDDGKSPEGKTAWEAACAGVAPTARSPASTTAKALVKPTSAVTTPAVTGEPCAGASSGPVALMAAT